MQGAQLIPQILDIFRNGPVDTKEQDFSQVKYPYESFPKREKVKKLMKNGKRCICMRDFFAIHPYLLKTFSMH